MVPTSKKSSNKTPWAVRSTVKTVVWKTWSVKTVRSTLPAEGVVLNFFRTGDDGCFHSIDLAFDSGVKWWTHVSSPVTIRNRKSLPSSW
ncbi:hypothetical protein TNCT_462001 [Trichonephila clavata]|uniref:Uncharacterized protein n=1 Tax=Trichonephila clavata TaxID=2740835 RepID=A0A8X6KPB5_TRICU|nr:hypothetical protein TNCT_462001 [Trichonephila clavata]